MLILQWDSDGNAFPIPPSQYNPLDEPSPLGLRLRKSPSLLELIQMRLSQSQGSASCEQNENFSYGQKETKSTAATDKLKAANFPASILRIGSWEVSLINTFIPFSYLELYFEDVDLIIW